jgi:hypothetical protein
MCRGPAPTLSSSREALPPGREAGFRGLPGLRPARHRNPGSAGSANRARMPPTRIPGRPKPPAARRRPSAREVSSGSANRGRRRARRATTGRLPRRGALGAGGVSARRALRTKPRVSPTIRRRAGSRYRAAVTVRRALRPATARRNGPPQAPPATARRGRLRVAAPRGQRLRPAGGIRRAVPARAIAKAVAEQVSSQGSSVSSLRPGPVQRGSGHFFGIGPEARRYAAVRPERAQAARRAGRSRASACRQISHGVKTG